MKFRQKVYRIVSSIPKGKVMTYGQVAAEAGSPRAARQVGYALRALGLEEEIVPWWRVINAEGRISINHQQGGEEKNLQKILLEMDGVKVDKDMRVNLLDHLF